MDEAVGAAAEVICVDLEVERKPLHPLLRGEVCTQRVNANVHLERGEKRIGVNMISDKETYSINTGFKETNKDFTSRAQHLSPMLPTFCVRVLTCMCNRLIHTQTTC